SNGLGRVVALHGHVRFGKGVFCRRRRLSSKKRNREKQKHGRKKKLHVETSYGDWLALCSARIPGKMRNRTSACIVLLFPAFTLSAQTPSVAVPKQLAQPSVPHFRDVSPEVGLRTLPHTNLDRRYVIETMSGGGAAFLDCENNGNLDIAVVNDSSIDRYLAGGDPMITL